MKQKLLSSFRLRVVMLVAILCSAFTGTVWGADETVTLTQSALGLTGSYTSNTEKTIDGIAYVYTDLMKSNDNIQAKASTGVIYNRTAFSGDIKSVAITHSGTARATTILGSSNGSDWTQVATGSGSITADFSSKGYKYFKITRGSNAAYWTKIEITYSTSSSLLNQSDLTVTNTSTNLAFDLYNSSAVQVINYTTSSTGDITIEPATSSFFSYVHDSQAKTITVTPLAVTSAAQTVTISQEADENYYGGTATFTVSVANSDPNLPGSQNNPYTVSQARAAIDAETGTQNVYATGIVSEIVTAYNAQYSNITFDIIDEGGSDILRAYRCTGNDADKVAVGDEVVVSGSLTKYGDIYEFAQGCELVSLTHPVNTTPSIEVSPATINATAAVTEGTINVTYNNFTFDSQVTELVFCESNGTTLATYNWLSTSFDANGSINYSIGANEGEARTAYMKVYSLDGEANDVYSELITITQAAPVIDYATLPFEWAGGGKNDLLALTGVTSSGLGSDYASGNSPYLVKFDTEGDYIQVKTDSQPGVVTIDVKMLGGAATSHIKVQGSSDGETFTDVETLTISGSQNSILSLETSNSFAATDRYVRLYFNKGANVGVGPITIAKASTDPVINAAASIELSSESTSGEIDYTISNPVDGTSLTASEEADWIDNVMVGTEKVTFTTSANTGAARSATITLSYGSITKEVIITQAEHIDKNTYSLATTITSGKRYMIANNENVVMGGKNASKNYFDAITGSTLSETTLSVASNLGAHEFIIYGPDARGFYAIYDPVAEGYLYASSSSNNDLSIQTINDDNGVWEIDLTNETVTAQGTNTHNQLRYNSANPRFSCYESGQAAVKFYVKDGDVAEPTTVPVNLNGNGYATFSSTNALDFLDYEKANFSAWQISSVSGTAITFSQIDKHVAAGTGILLKGTANSTIYLNILPSGGATLTNNKLVGITTATAVNDNEYYGLSGNEFKKVNAGTVPAGKALLPASVVNNVSGNARLSFVFEDDNTTTGISEELIVNSEKFANAPVYNLNGQRVNDLKKGGLYIVGGKKVIVK